MRNFIGWIIAFSTSFVHAQQNVGIGTVTPNASAMLDVRSTNKGFLIPSHIKEILIFERINKCSYLIFINP